MATINPYTGYKTDSSGTRTKLSESERKEVARSISGDDGVAKVEAAISREQTEAKKKAYSRMGFYTSSVTQTERGTKQVTKYHGSSRPSGNIEDIHKGSGQVVEISGTRNVWQGGSPSLKDIAPDPQRGKVMTPKVQADTRKQIEYAKSPLTPRIVSQQIINDLSPAEKRVQKQRQDPNKYGGLVVEKADTSLIGKAKFLLGNANQKVSSFIGQFKSKDPVTGERDYVFGGTKWINPEIERSRTRETEIRAKLEDATGFRKGLLKYQLFSEKAGQFMLGAEKGTRERVRDKPVSFVASTAAFAVLPKGLSLIGSGAQKLGAVTGLSNVAAVTKTASFTSKALGVGLTTAYGGSVAYRVGTQPSAFKAGQKSGDIFAGEILPMAVGGVAGAKFWRWQEGTFATMGRKEIAVEKLVPQDVLIGKNRFPLSRSGTSKQIRSDQLRLFTTKSQRLPIEKYSGSRYEAGQWTDVSPSVYHVKVPGSLYHATGNRGFLSNKFYTQAGTSEFGGLYGSYGVSPYFTRTSGSVGRLDNLFGSSLFQPYNKPGVAAITPRGFVAQSPLKYPSFGKTANTQFQGIAGRSTGKAYIPGYKTEVEAILPTGTEVFKTGQKYFFKYNNVKVPIDQYSIGKNVLSNMLSSSVGFSSYYGGVGSYPSLTSGSFAGGFLGSLSSLRSSSKTSPASLVSLPSSSYKPSSSSFFGSSIISSSYRPSSSSLRSSAFSSSYKPSSSSFFGSSSSFSTRISPPSYPSIPSSPGSPGSPGKGSGYYISPPKEPPRKPPKVPIDFSIDTGNFNKKQTFKSIDNPFNPKYFASVEASVLNIKGKLPKQRSIMTGLGLRPIKF